MSEQYKCNKCGEIIDIAEMQCSECGDGQFERLRRTKGGDGSHWEGCADVHYDCKIAQLEAELARLKEENHALDQINRDIQTAAAHLDEVLAELARRDEEIEEWKCAAFVISSQMRLEIDNLKDLIKRLKEALPTFKRGHYYCDDCWYSCPKAEDGCCDERAGEDCNCGADEWNAIIDLLMKELE